MTARIALLLLSCCYPVQCMKVLVTGACGRTGKLVFQKLKEDYQVTPVGLVRSKKAAKALRNTGCAEPAEVVRGDATVQADLAGAMAGCESVVLCTSAVPQIRPLSIVKLLFKKNILRKKDAGRPLFRFSAGGTPEEVDWLGAKLQVRSTLAFV